MIILIPFWFKYKYKILWEREQWFPGIPMWFLVDGCRLSEATPPHFGLIPSWRQQAGNGPLKRFPALFTWYLDRFRLSVAIPFHSGQFPIWRQQTGSGPLNRFPALSTWFLDGFRLSEAIPLHFGHFPSWQQQTGSGPLKWKLFDYGMLLGSERSGTVLFS